jgi:hypothetical protein
MAHRIAGAAATLLAAACLSAVALAFLPVPFSWIGLSWALAGLVLAALAPRVLRLPLTLAACVPFALGLGDLMFPPIVERTELPSPFREDPLLGWTLNPSNVTHAPARVEGELIFDVAYSTDPAGFRVSPPDRGDQVEGCLLFFADSFTFGQGVSDDRTFPYQVGLQTNGRFHVVNLAVPGYGAQQMLASIERGALATNPPCEPTHIFYAALPHHILRAAQKTSFSESGPQYQLGRNGILEYVGTNPRPSVASADLTTWRGWHALLKGPLQKSRILRALKDRPAHTTEDDIKLYFAIVSQAFRLFEQRWPEAELHVISWDIHDFFSNGQERFHKGLEATGAEVHFIDEILPGYTHDLTKYGLHRLDLHPNALAHELVASYISEQVLAPTSPPAPTMAQASGRTERE